MYSFKNDYAEGAHPRILQAMADANMEQSEGYGLDEHSLAAAQLIRARLGGDPDGVDVHFLCGGTQTNLTAISAFLRPHEAAVATNTAHIFVHETGAVEATGHKVLTVPSTDGKLSPDGIQKVLDAHPNDEHMVKPRLVKISNSTEIGSVYTLKELEDLSRFCREKKLLLYADGARLGSALASKGGDVTLADMRRLMDAFYIGGTKNGALLGEALVIVNDALKEDFRYHIKQKGALMAKGKVLGIQFEELFRDDLFFDLARHANAMAQIIAGAIEKAGYGFLTPSPSNQIFPILPNDLIERLQKNWAFYVWSKIDDGRSSIRLVTSWATKEETVREFIKEF
ncbi:MAG: aminotransferase class I/II-fold pyridoxal phosphate-dependent enzyme [Synergistaceae bacterium]|jgi:threonine aldolase|nr:aminotransferase class I/II-fold pyridoxal phosphate-dependent enzyme [Synergistaceae bacterium]